MGAGADLWFQLPSNFQVQVPGVALWPYFDVQLVEQGPQSQPFSSALLPLLV